MKASELKEFDLSELTIPKKRFSVDGIDELINRVGKYKKPHYIDAINRNKRNQKYLNALNRANTHIEPTKQQQEIDKYLND